MSRKFKLFSIATLIAILIFTPLKVAAVSGQWSSSGSIIYYNDGNLGLGTASPSSKLHLLNGGFTIDNGDAGSSLISADGNLVLRTDRDGDGTNNYVAFQDYTGAFTLTATGAGLVGIGTSTPAGKLHVIDSATWSGRFVNSASEVRTAYPGGYGIFVTSSASDSTYLLQLNRSNLATAVFEVRANGNAFLDGVLKAKEIQVKTNVWADYVFEDNYELKSLEEVEKFVEDNNHLPNIPSAKDIEEKGLSVGDMQAKQMEKIEELTLYLIEMNKRVDELERVNGELRGLVKN